MTFTDKELSELKDAVRGVLSEKRFRHTEGVCEEITRMGSVYLPDRISELRAAALLHDIAKELPIEEQIAICQKHDDPELSSAVNSPAILHGHAASYLIPDLYSKYALPEIISAIYKHTTGSEEMSVFEKLLFLADFTEPNRTWTECKNTRERFWHDLPDDPVGRLRRLDDTVLSVLEFTLDYLRGRGITTDPATENAATALRRQIQPASKDNNR
ncbi:MAG: bis(5'-nucleosyl)-tetraphosphatase (symmetrical) YqeK [Clostridia bacterium]|nr:bis(5'-nucleosyl)-tetraphosphatase (symmetrical) YqeK [Clostridia bacterium]